MRRRGLSRGLALLGAAAAYVLLAAGCGRTQETGYGDGVLESEKSTRPQTTGTPDDREVETRQREQEPEFYEGELPRDYEGTLTMWGWDDRYAIEITEAFCEKYPNVTIEYLPVENGDLFQTYQTAMMTGGTLPDIGWAILAYRNEIFELDIWEALEEAPYGFSLEEVSSVLHSRMVNSKGHVCGIEQALTAAGLAYRRDLALAYLGTDDPGELEAMLPDWDSFIEKGAEVYRESGGKVCFLRSIAEAQGFIREQQKEPWVQGNVVKLTETIRPSLEMAAAFRDSHTSDCLEAWTPEWYESIGGDRYMFIAAAPWVVEFEIEKYDPRGKDSGRWGLMRSPGGSAFWGGTTMGITRTCQDKRLAWEFLKFATLSKEGAECLKGIGMFTTALKPYEENPELKNYYNDWFGEQNIGAYFLDVILPGAVCREISCQDGEIHDAMNLINAAMQRDASMTAKDAMAYLKEYLEDQLPGYKIE